MALKEYFEVDVSNGKRIDVHLLDDEIDVIPSNFVLGWGQERNFHDPIYDFTISDWLESKDNTEILNIIKSQRKDEFKSICEEKIINGFQSSNGHWYRTNRDDQTNMIGQKDELIDDETILTVNWKTEDMGYISHTREEWLIIYKEAFFHKKTQLYRYNELKKIIDNCDSVEELNLIEW